MQDIIETTISCPKTPSKEATNNGDLPKQAYDFATLLSELGVDYLGVERYWHVGTPRNVQGWILHLSVIAPQLLDLAKKVLPYLISKAIPFKIVQNSVLAEQILNGDYGSLILGKVIAVFPPDDGTALDLAKSLIDMTSRFKGPSILTDFGLKNIVHTRYGSISPIWINDPKGRPIKHIYNEKGELIPDSLGIPFSFPPGVPWPFHQIALPVTPKRNKLINAKYYPLSFIRESPRGNIIKAIYFKSIWNIKACVIKQGRLNMCADHFGRDVADRLRWQEEICKDLLGVIPIPKIFDYFIDNEDTYLAMEYVKGKTIFNWLDSVYNKRSWFDLPNVEKLIILDVLSQILDIVYKLHLHGYVHRDITPGNFIITNRNQVIPIDLELCWPLRSRNYASPFLLGTPGFMSPQQLNADAPTTKDDIFALGSMIFVATTRLNPSKISTLNSLKLQSTLYFFTRDNQLSALIAGCLQPDPEHRPDLNVLQNTIRACINSHNGSTRKSPSVQTETVSSDKLSWIIQSAIKGLANPKLLTSSGQWKSLSTFTTNQVIGELEETQPHIGWHTGTAGPLWLLALAKSAAFDIDSCEEAYMAGWNLVESHFANSKFGNNPSLFFGDAGIALALKEGIRSNWLLNTGDTLGLLKECFSTTSDEIILSTGISGQGVSLLQASLYLDPEYTNSLLTSYLEKILGEQRPDGSWMLESKNSSNPPLGLAEGIAGIIWFLLSYLQHHNDNKTETATRKAIDWITKSKATKPTWNQIQKDQTGRIWFSARTPGDLTALMLKAYKILGDEKYKITGEANLRAIPDRPISSDFSLNRGLSRIGELYMDAFTVLKKDQYMEKAAWITNFFTHTFLPISNDSGYWNTSDNNQISADLFDGNSGIIHYLMRYLSPDKLPNPFY